MVAAMSGGLTVQVNWLGLRVGGQLALIRPTPLPLRHAVPPSCLGLLSSLNTPYCDVIPVICSDLSAHHKFVLRVRYVQSNKVLSNEASLGYC